MDIYIMYNKTRYSIKDKITSVVFLYVILGLCLTIENGPFELSYVQ